MITRSTHPPSLIHHVWLPLFAFAALVLLLESSCIDLWLADRIYAFSGGTWRLRDAWLTQDLIHEGGRMLVGLMALVLLLVVIANMASPRLHYWRRGSCYLLVSVVLSGLAVNLLKKAMHVDCPWDLVRYGGEFPYVRNFLPHPGSFRYGGCFPAGHASAAYAWFGLYYVAREYASDWKWCALSIVMAVGLVFGIGQQLRGAHFISHDLWTIGMCWFFSTVIYLMFFRSTWCERP